MSNPTAPVVDEVFLQVRAKILEIGASLDRIARADEDSAQEDPRLRRIRESIEILNTDGFNRAERIQLIFSDPYDSDWDNK
jgi:hypothetical protein